MGHLDEQPRFLRADSRRPSTAIFLQVSGSIQNSGNPNLVPVSYLEVAADLVPVDGDGREGKGER